MLYNYESPTRNTCLTSQLMINLSKAIVFPTHYSMLGWIKFTTYKNDYKPVHKNSCHDGEKYNLKDYIIDLWNSFFSLFIYIYRNRFA